MSGSEFLSPDQFTRLQSLASGSYRPREIRELKAKIEAETRAAEVNAISTGQVDRERVQKIVKMKLELDGLYCAWIEGKLD